MPWSTVPAECKKLERAGVVVGAAAVFSRPADEAAADGGPARLELRFQRDMQRTPAQFRTQLIGAGTVAAPLGELGAWLAHLNAAADVSTAL